MKAILQRSYGSPASALRLEEIDKPEAGDGEVLVRVRASSVNSGDWRQVRANPFFIRFMLGVRRPKKAAFAADAAGVVEAVGAGVSGLSVGDEVFGIRTGAAGEYVSGKNFVPKPKHLSFEQAAALPVAGVTALQAVREWSGGVKPGQKVLINGAGGGVGHFCVQIAKADGAEVTAVTSTDKIDMARSLGADHVLDYSSTDFTRGDVRYDMIIDCSGNRSFGACLRALTPEGTLVFVGAYHGVLRRVVFANLRRRLLKQRIAFSLAQVRRVDLATLAELTEAGKLRPIIDRSYPLAQTADAVGYAEKQQVRGKVVITVAGA
ncbi:MAG TPA: NAD(P)-dependent alcohol dehydrogenase [Candidatus Limnocylindria bacterium]|nr:NAD(P)-dependent alcohol dehydrogenase [Candidatus Limnocylindria bacterium]